MTACDTEGNTPLHFAAESGKSEIVKCILLCCAADIEAQKQDETTPLHIASRHGRINVAKLIVEYKKGQWMLKMFIKKHHFITQLNTTTPT